MLIIVSGTWYLTKREEKKAQILGEKTYSTLPTAPHIGTWDWRGVDMVDTQALSSEFDTLKSQNINTVYVDISDYLDYYESKDDSKIQTLKHNLGYYINLAAEKGIAIEALAGDTSWGKETHAYIQPIYIDFVQQFNSDRGDQPKLSGLQFDVEIHNDPDFNDNKSTFLIQYARSIQGAIKHYKKLGANFSLGYTMPYWFDNENNNIPEITINHKTAPIGFHIFDILNGINSGYVALMDYRNFTDGSDGSVAHAQNEIVYTEKSAPNTKLIIAQETTDVPERKITFYGKKYSSLVMAVTKLNATFSPHSTYKGFAIHDIEGMQNLLQNNH